MRRRTILAAGGFLWAAEGPKDLRLFLLCGQSNMAGRGDVEESDRRSIEHVWSMNKAHEWGLATDPLHFDNPAIMGVGLGRTFARVLASVDPEARIGLIPCAFGGSSLHEWEPGTVHYENTLKRARIGLASGRLSGVLWHQGEAECSEKVRAESYLQRFSKVVASFRSELGEDVPVVVGELGEFFQAPYAGIVNEQLARVPLAVRRSAFVSSTGLGHRGDDIHFDSAGFREFGRRYAHAYLGIDATWRVGQGEKV